MTIQTDVEGGGFVTDSTIADTTSVASVQSSVSTRSSRSGLTRQGSRKKQNKKNSSDKLLHLLVVHEDRMWFECIFSLPLSCSRINVQASELWEEVRKGQDKKTTQEDCGRNTAARSDGAGYALLFEIIIYILCVHQDNCFFF